MYLVLLLRALESCVYRAGRRLSFFRLSFNLFEIMPVVGIIIYIFFFFFYCWAQYLALRNFTLEFSDGFCIFYIARIFPSVVRIPG
jgi:hypothetical protein